MALTEASGAPVGRSLSQLVFGAGTATSSSCRARSPPRCAPTRAAAQCCCPSPPPEASPAAQRRAASSYDDTALRVGSVRRVLTAAGGNMLDCALWRCRHAHSAVLGSSTAAAAFTQRLAGRTAPTLSVAHKIYIGPFFVATYHKAVLYD